jgi:excisionase family DNA binding protein
MLRTIEDAARLLAVSRRTICRWLAAGTLAQVRLPGRLVRIHDRDIQRLIQRGTIGHG